jgi:hypothetical protein
MNRALLCLALVLPLAACETPDATYAVIDNGYPAVADGGDASGSVAVYRGWWLVATFPDPVPGGSSSESERIVAGSDHAYLVLAPGWDPASGSAPVQLLPAMTDVLSVDRGGTLHILVDDAHVTGNCAAGHPLTQPQADLITQSIFPATFAGFAFDAATCTLTPRGDASP